MDPGGTVQGFQDLAEEFLQAARDNLAAELPGPAYFNALHALELAVKAAIVHAEGEVPRTHNVGGLFGRRYRSVVGSETTRRVNRLLADYDAPRYPEWLEPSEEALDDSVKFIGGIVERVVPELCRKPPPPLE